METEKRSLHQGSTELGARRDLTEWARQRLGVVPDDWQADVLTTPKRRVILNCSRQSGKAEAAVLRVLHTIVACPGSVSLLYLPTPKQSHELLCRVLELYRHLENDTPARRKTRDTLELVNGSRVIALSGKASTMCTYSADLIVVAKAARVPDPVFDELTPMLAVTGGALILLSTPCGASGYFAKAWKDGDPEVWHKVRITAPMLPGITLSHPEPEGVCPRIPLDFLEAERAMMPEAVFLSTYYGEFLPDTFSVFSYAAIEQAMLSDVEPWDL